MIRNEKFFVPQYSSNDCGLASLSIVLRKLGVRHTSSELRMHCPPSRNGVSLYHLVVAAEKFGLISDNTQTSSPGKTLSRVSLPALFQCNNHYQVVLERDSEGCLVADPSSGMRWLHATEFPSELVVSSFTRRLVNDRAERISEWQSLCSLFRKGMRESGQSTPRLVAISLTIAALLGISSGGISIAFPLLTKQIVDVAIQQKLTQIIEWGILIAILGVLISAIGFARDWLSYRAGRMLSDTFIGVGLLRSLNADLEFHRFYSSAEIVARIEESEKLKYLIGQPLCSLLVDLVTIALFLPALALFNLKIAFAVLLIAAFLFVLATSIATFSKAVLAQELIADSESYRRASELISSIESIRLYSVGARVANRLHNLYLNASELASKRRTIEIANDRINDLVCRLTPMLVLLIEVGRPTFAPIDLGNALAAASYAGILCSPLISIANFPFLARRIALSMRLLGEVLDSQLEHFEGTRPPNINADSFKFVDVGFEYPGESLEVLKSVSVELGTGFLYVVFGPSGTGKSTFARILAGLLRPTAGKIAATSKGLELPQCSMGDFVAYCSQESTLFRGTLRENIEFFRTPNDERLNLAIYCAYIDDWIQNLPSGLDTCVAEDGFGLSEGQKKRILIARTCFEARQLIVLDEATSSLDEPTELKILNRIRAELSSSTLVIVSHRSALRNSADYTLKIDGGQVVLESTNA